MKLKHITAWLLLLLCQTTFAITNCTLDGSGADCVQITEQATQQLTLGIGGLISIAAIVMAIIIFWLMMFIHALKHSFKNKALWVVIILLGNVIGAVVYYFAIERTFQEPPAV